ncbi:Crp/Fnr family transcriptional regulator [Pedobacter hartonius]|uniref:cAMP-binding domain of CRP or a regulatory subunit of cAMP-dependent protein kinases n=1 Tax=Pedobacter hartonius TaxID=425514 RepID=A0A1H4GLX8_9SPHI|nr:Crp/Fnr family transcriptional regulator [Pedobacter hartonius]SEB10623.1 cAMP-binding domain of CRP or a regulatory subunit of cAMP-dependent protein kinases [Pedobacter hartonius]
MDYKNFFNYLFPGDKLSSFMLAQSAHSVWIKELESQLKTIDIQHGRILALGRSIPDVIYFLEKGAIKGYEDHQGKKKITHLWESPCIVGDIISFFYESISSLNIEIVQDSSLLVLERPALSSVIITYPESYLIRESILLKHMIYYEKQYLDFQKLSAFERFKKLLSTRKGIELIFSKTDLASYLCISRSSYNEFYARK